jgi:hypothetical protein
VADCAFTAFAVAVGASCVDKQVCGAVVLNDSTSEADCVAVRSFGAACVYTNGLVEEACALDEGAVAVCTTSPEALLPNNSTCSEVDCTFTALQLPEAPCLSQRRRPDNENFYRNFLFPFRYAHLNDLKRQTWLTPGVYDEYTAQSTCALVNYNKLLIDGSDTEYLLMCV